MQSGVRNQLTGTIWDVKTDGIMAQVTMWMGDTQIASVMTRESMEEAGFATGDSVTALVKAVNVVLVKQ